MSSLKCLELYKRAIANEEETELLIKKMIDTLSIRTDYFKAAQIFLSCIAEHLTEQSTYGTPYPLDQFVNEITGDISEIKNRLDTDNLMEKMYDKLCELIKEFVPFDAKKYESNDSLSAEDLDLFYATIVRDEDAVKTGFSLDEIKKAQVDAFIYDAKPDEDELKEFLENQKQ